MSKLTNMKKNLSDPKTRSVFIILIIILLIGLIIGYIEFRKSIAASKLPTAGKATGAPPIRSIPGIGTPSRPYIKLQQQQNIQEAQKALKEKTAAVPTVIGTTYLGQELNQPPGTKAPGCSVEDLRRAREAGVTAFELRCRGCSAEAMKAAGYTASDLKAAGFTAKQLRAAGFTAKQLKDAGFTAKQLKDAGFTARQLKNAGFNAAQLKAAGFTAKQLKDAGFTAKQLEDAGFTPAELRAAGFNVLDKKDCSVANLKKEKMAGMSASQLKKCGAAALKAAGYTAKQLMDAGFTAKQLKAAGFTAKQLKDAGFTAKQLKDAGFDAAQLKAAGFDAKQLKDAGFTAKQLKDAGFTAKQLKDAGFTAQQLKDAGFTDGDLIRAGFPIDKIRPAKIIKTKPKKKPSPTSKLPTTKLAPIPGSPEQSLQDKLAKIQAQEALSMSQADWQNTVDQLQQNMSMEANDILSGWTTLPSQQFVEGPPPKTMNPGATLKAAAFAQQQANIKYVIPAYTPIYAVLDTGINSDEPSPIMATIVEGKLKGSKVVGTFARSGEGVILTFTQIKVPQLLNALPINAYAIDPSTAKVSMASSVNNHFLRRYGALFAASFVSGYGEALKNTGSQVTVLPFIGALSYQTKDLSPEQLALVGLGKVGTNVANVLQKNVNIPPTVRLKAGNGIALYLRQALAVPKNEPTPQFKTGAKS